MGRILIVHDSGYGATTDAAKILSGHLTQEGCDVDLGLVGIENILGYDAVLIGSPIRFSRCTPKIKKFLKRNHNMLSCMKAAFFFTCMSITNDESDFDLPLYIDPSFNDPNKPRARIKTMENNHTVSYYLKHFFKIIPDISPLSVAFFKGRLNTPKLSMFHRLIMRFAMFALPEIKNGDYINALAMRDWAALLANQLKSD